MIERAQVVDIAVSLTQRALEILDEIGDTGPNVYLQGAIDMMTDAPVPRTQEEAGAMSDTPEFRAMQKRLGLS